jgi:1-aminocyclopropane-1-carboxylate deaminase/D-cysteine desulfhydrase-like pyridoxal-dependent ACC family enzyme
VQSSPAPPLTDLIVNPTPLVLAEEVSRSVGCEVWVKRDDQTHPRYGGNKVRKLTPLLAEALAQGVTHVLTVGAAGSHHVLATAVHGGAVGLTVEAALVPQPASAHVEAMLRASAAQASALHPSASFPTAMAALALRSLALRSKGARPWIIPVGGSNALGSSGYLAAQLELAAQLAAMGAPAPDVQVCALGSGGTLAGLLAGRAIAGELGEVWGVRVTPRMAAPSWRVASLARAVLRLRGYAGPCPAVRVFEGALGEGYGRPTDDARRARELFARDGVLLDDTYTAKAAAGLLALARRTPRRYLFWQTLSSAPLGPLQGSAPPALPRRLRSLLR